MPAKHVQKYVFNAQKIAMENLRWRNVKNSAESVLMLAVSVQKNAEV